MATGDCQAIDEFIKRVETGAGNSAPLLGNFTGIESRKEGRRTVRRYALRWPNVNPSEILQLEIVDEEPAKSGERQSELRRLRIRPHSVSHWINVPTSAVSIMHHDMGFWCRNTRSAMCYISALSFESKDGGLAVGFHMYNKDGKQVVDEVTLEVTREPHPWCRPDAGAK